MRKLLPLVAALAVAVPTIAHADSKTYAPPYKKGPQGGDSFNFFSVNEANGSVAVLRVNPVGINNGLGCGGSGGYAYLAAEHEASTPVSTLAVNYHDALIDPYTFFSVSVRQANGFLGTKVVRGPIAGDGTVTLRLAEPATGTLTAWFGIQVTSACPNVDGGSATFPSVTFSG